MDVFTEEVQQLVNKMVVIDWVDEQHDWPYFFVLNANTNFMTLCGADEPAELGGALHSGGAITVYPMEVASITTYNEETTMSNECGCNCECEIEETGISDVIDTSEIDDEFVYVLNSDKEKTFYDVLTSDHGINDLQVNLRYPLNDDDWTDQCRGKIAATLKDHGNGVRVSFLDYQAKAEHRIDFDYAEFEEMRALITAYDDLNDRPVTKITKFKRMD